jgi:hypothetical protein
MYAIMLFTRRTARMLVAISLLFVLVACGNTTTSTSVATSTPQETNSSNSTVPSFQKVHSITFDVAKIHVYSGHGIICLNYETLNAHDPNSLIANLVLATNRLTYDTSELQQMETYATVLYGMTKSLHSPVFPNTLSWVPGTIVGNFPDLRFPGIYVGGGCFGEMELTNTGNKTILIHSFNMRLTSTPQRTSPSYQYRMIDICSLIGESYSCPPMAGGGGAMVDYFLLKAEPAGTTFAPQKQDIMPDNQSGSDITLNPNTPYVLPVLFYFTSTNNLVYSLTPELVLDTPNGVQQHTALPQLATTLYFANPSQFSCYTLKGDTFVREASLYELGYCV